MKDTLSNRFIKWVDSAALFLEKDRLSLIGIFLYVILIAFARDLSEYFLLDTEFVNGSQPWIFSISHHVSFFVLTFLGLVLIVKVFSGVGLRKCMNFTVWYYWIILLPPWIDHFLFGLEKNYAYFSWTDFISAFFTLGGNEFHPGQGVEVIVIFFFLFSYVFWKHRDGIEDISGRSMLALRLGMMAAFTILFMFILGTPGAYLPVGSEGGIPVFPNFDSTKFVQFHLFIFAYYLMASVVLVFVLTYIAFRDRFRREIRALRPFQTAFFAAIVVAGMALSWRDVDPSMVFSILDRPYWVNLAYAIPTVVSAILAWQTSVIWNDLSDVGSDSPLKDGRVLASGLLQPRVLREASVVLAMVALSVSLLMSVMQFLIMLVILVMAYVYSFPPVRFKTALLSPMLIGLGTFLAFLYGAFAPFAEIGYIGGVPFLSGSTLCPLLSGDVVLIGLFMFIGLVVGSMITDADGYDEDKAGGVLTIYTRFGMDRGVAYASLLIFASSLTPLFLFNSLADVVVFPLLGAIASLLFLRTRTSRGVMVVAMFGLVYAALRFLSIL
ncbi:MAG: UbiA family prenyltransferase [Methanomassiliicoccales archaeon]|jgi:4-hydroxybenzoate polyprenyltransferase|nr:UbiA family prenyltransferase [Methanomassiliicoccales archaeon]